MKQIKRKIAATIASLSILLNIAAPAYAVTTQQITGNGSYSDNNISTVNTNEKTVVQQNDAHVTNDINAQASTGNNDANDNTGGGVTVATGNAASTVDVSTRVNLNEVRNINPSNTGSDPLVITGNGSNSDNDISSVNSQSTSIYQQNYADIENDIDADANTGNNDANRNTGGDVAVITGHAAADVTVSNTANANVADLGNGNSASVVEPDMTISGNGSGSDNDISIVRDQALTLVQQNDALIRNSISANPDTGNNDANDNTGGDSMVDTGMALATVMVDNMANFNFANVGNEALVAPALSKINGNGSASENDLSTVLVDSMDIFQGESGDTADLFDVNNSVNALPDTGLNHLNRNTGSVLGDPMLISGHAVSDVTVSNTGNANIFGSGVTLPGGVVLSLGFDLNGLLSR